MTDRCHPQPPQHRVRAAAGVELGGRCCWKATYPAILALFCVDAAISHSTVPLVRSAASMMVTLVAFTALYALAPGQLGGRDVKVSGLVGLILGWFSWTAAFTGILLAWLLAAFAGVVLRPSRKSQPEGPPLGTCLVIAPITTALANS